MEEAKGPEARATLIPMHRPVWQRFRLRWKVEWGREEGGGQGEDQVLKEKEIQGRELVEE